MLPPHTRGCTVGELADRPQHDASPAYAGMHPRRAIRHRLERRFPRIRGDAPQPSRATISSALLPPHTRGCTAKNAFFCSLFRASPAYAGMHQRLHSRRILLGCFPRIRGDAPCGRGGRRGPAPLPPHTRGCTSARGGCRCPLAASPAYAGMHRVLTSSIYVRTRFPRIRGDAPCTNVKHLRTHALPPHTRGCTQGRGPPRRTWGASPAYAGMHLRVLDLHDAEESFPRIRGDAPFNDYLGGGPLPLPPHTRGCTAMGPSRSGAGAASPAYAGMHPQAAACAPLGDCFPRIRGDAPAGRAVHPISGRVPPHTRGCTRRPAQPVIFVLASPAYAGMHRLRRRVCRPARSFPRIRGDAPPCVHTPGDDGKLPPHTRGCTRVTSAS